MNKNMRNTLFMLALLTSGVVLVGCTPSTTPDRSNVITPTPTQTQAWSPTYVEIVSADGTTAKIKKGSFIEVITMRSENQNAWIASSSDPAIVKAGNGSPTNFAAPVLEGLKKGEATITITNAQNGKVVVFSVKVEE